MSPNVSLVAHLNQLDVDPHVVAIAAHAPFENVLDIKSAANLRDGLAGNCVRGGGCDHAEVLWVETAKPRNHFVGQAGAEVVLVRVAAEIRKGQHGELDFGRDGMDSEEREHRD